MARTEITLARPGPPHRAGRPGLHRPAPAGVPTRAPPAAGARPHRPAPDRLGQRPAAGPLPAAVQPARALPDRRCSTGPPTGAPRELFEYWGHEASLIPVDLQPLLRWRMARGRTRRLGPACGGIAERAARSWSRGCSTRCATGARSPPPRSSTTRRAEHRQLGVELVGREDRRWSGCSGPARSPPPGATPPSPGVYDLTERVLPRGGAGRADPDRRRRAPRAGPGRRRGRSGVAAEAELRDYFRLPVAGARQAVAELVEAGELRAGRRSRAGGSRAYLHAEARAAPLGAGRDPGQPVRPADLGAQPRTERLFGFHYRIEIYMPAAAARVRLLRAAVPARRRARRPGRPQGRPRRPGVLLMPAAWVEPGHAAGGDGRGAGRRAAGSPAGWAWSGGAAGGRRLRRRAGRGAGWRARVR